ncbi:MAG: class I SAM-dependent methyltransferase [Anaerolineae bacterium]|nr:class I SAM-dependent methyltransferase [Anaerolineae bacterium]
MSEKLVRNYYNGCAPEEWRRLIKDAYHRLELETTLHFLEKYLPRGGQILDAGGGPGRYTLELARRGYHVVLLDLTPANLEFARQQIQAAGLEDNVEQVVEGSIVDLSRFADGTFDAVLCLGGPLSHVLDQGDREKAMSELVRVVKTDAPIFVSVMGRLSVLVVELVLAPHELEAPFFPPMRDTGDYPGHSGFTACHFFLPEELESAFQSRGVAVLEMAGLEGLGSHHAEHVNALAENGERWRVWLETHYQTCTHPAVVGISEHMLLVGKKR